MIPSRNEPFLAQTVDDIFAKATGAIEVIVHLDGYWPDPPLVERPNLHLIHRSKSVGLRAGLNAAAAVATGDYVMKADAHCMFSEGFDEVLAADCGDNWVCVPTRHRLDADNWQVNDGNRRPINYLYLDASNDGINVKEWRQKNNDTSLDAVEIDDILTCQGSCFFLPRAYWYELELLDEANYGSFRKDPQEVTFKAWCSGGRVVRNKRCWYAHLHKGKQHGRGYKPNKTDWNQGDEYVKKWWTDEAWDKQTKPFGWLLQKFSDMPGWEGYKWMPAVDEPELPNLYQVLEVGGQPFSKPKPGRTGSRFWNEGKWMSFVDPLLPEDCTDQTFVEMGCDAGLFLKLATDRGFRRVVGVEKNRTPVKWAEKYRDALGYNYQVLKRQLGGNLGENGTFDIDELPVADITLMSTFHYYIDINAWVKYLDRLKAKSCYVLVVSRTEMREDHWLAKASYDAVRDYFSDWDVVGGIDNVSTDGDPSPRDLYSVLFKSPLVSSIPIESIDARNGDEMGQAVADLAQKIAVGGDVDLWSTDYYLQWLGRKQGKWSERTARRFVQLKADVMTSVVTNGLLDPIIVQRDGLKVSDGGHRLAVLKALGYKNVFVRQV